MLSHITLMHYVTFCIDVNLLHVLHHVTKPYLFEYSKKLYVLFYHNKCYVNVSHVCLKFQTNNRSGASLSHVTAGCFLPICGITSSSAKTFGKSPALGVILSEATT